jgi:hypothetical protein
MKIVLELPGTIPIVSLFRALMHMGLKISYMREFSTEMRMKTEPLTAEELSSRERVGGPITCTIEGGTPDGH